MNLEEEFKIKAGQLLALQENLSLILTQLDKIYAPGANMVPRPTYFQEIVDELKKQSPLILHACKSMNCTLAEVAAANREEKE